MNVKVQKQTEVKFTLPIGDIPDSIRLEAESQAKEAYVMTLLRHADISAAHPGISRYEKWRGEHWQHIC